jgi:hypothetical protein
MLITSLDRRTLQQDKTGIVVDIGVITVTVVVSREFPSKYTNQQIRSTDTFPHQRLAWPFKRVLRVSHASVTATGHHLDCTASS